VARHRLRLGDVGWSIEGDVVTTRFFLMHAVRPGLAQDKNRRHAVVGAAEALARGSYTETRDLLEAAEQHRMRT